MPRDSRHPERHWQPWLGDHCGIGPRDFGDLTCEQLLGCFDYVKG